MTRAQLRAQINLLEALEGLVAASDDLASAEFDGERAVNLQLEADKQPIAFAHSLPPEVVEAGLRAMRLELAKQIEAGMAEAVAA